MPRLTVTGPYVDLEFGNQVPVRLSGKFAHESVAQSAAKVIAREMGLDRFTMYTKAVGARVLVTMPRKRKQKRSK